MPLGFAVGVDPAFISNNTTALTTYPYTNIGTNSVWNAWLTAGTGTYSNNLNLGTWGDWTGTSNSQYNQQVWVEWTDEGWQAGDGAYHRRAVLSTGLAPPSPRDVAIRARRRAVGALRNRVAQRKAEALLLENLDVVQRAEWAASGRFHVDAPSGRRYMIRRGLAGNVELVRGHESRAHTSGRRPRYCCHVSMTCPIEDNVLTQKLWLESREDEFLRLANVM